MSRHTWQDLIHARKLPDWLALFGLHILERILEERRRTWAPVEPVDTPPQ